jgi:hypothetical protein
MIRKNIFEILKEQYNVKDEIFHISSLFESKLIHIRYQSYDESLEEYISEKIFQKWESRGTSINYADMRRRLGLDKPINYNDINQILNLLEYYENIIGLFLTNYKSDVRIIERSPNFNILLENIEKLLDHLHHEVLYIADEEKVLIVPKNPAGTAVAEISTEQTGIAILKYNHASMKGDVEEKRKLLVEIAREYEPILDKPPDGHATMFTKTNGLLNCLHIRHNNIEGKYSKELPDDLEKWYDELYQMLLLCVLLSDNVERMIEVQKLLDTMKKGVEK